MCPRNCENFIPDGVRFNEVLEYVRPFIPKCREFWLAGLGESFLNEQYIGILEKLDFFPHRFRCRYVTFTNGTLFNEEVKEKFMQLMPNSRLIFSLDAGTRDTYKRIRRFDLFDKVVENIRSYLRDPRRNLQKQVVYITYNINLLNVADVEQMVSMWKGEKISGLGFNPTCITGAKGIENYVANSQNYHIFKEAGEKIRQTAARCRMSHVDVVSPLESYFDLEAREKFSLE
jgi:MoaA/NifB/PqqE/SkfB family radical SAM enzyme